MLMKLLNNIRLRFATVNYSRYEAENFRKECNNIATSSTAFVLILVFIILFTKAIS
jgi:hypothetical protein